MPLVKRSWLSFSRKHGRHGKMGWIRLKIWLWIVTKWAKKRPLSMPLAPLISPYRTKWLEWVRNRCSCSVVFVIVIHMWRWVEARKANSTSIWTESSKPSPKKLATTSKKSELVPKKHFWQWPVILSLGSNYARMPSATIQLHLQKSKAKSQSCQRRLWSPSIKCCTRCSSTFHSTEIFKLQQ